MFGPEVGAPQQQALRDALDLGARFVRSALGRELPPFTVWGYTDQEALIRVYAETAPTEPANSRDIWTRGTFATVTYRKAWFGPQWLLLASNQNTNLTKIAVHEVFHVLQSELAGDLSLNSGFDDLPRAGPRWIAEGSAELVGFLALADARLVGMPVVRNDWAQRAKSSPVSLQRLAFLRGQFDAGSNAWGIMPWPSSGWSARAGRRRCSPTSSRSDAEIAWEAAFTAAFGKTVDAFYAEFAAYRAGL